MAQSDHVPACTRLISNLRIKGGVEAGARAHHFKHPVQNTQNCLSQAHQPPLPSQLLFSSNSQTSWKGFLHCLATSSFSSPCQPSTKLPLLPNIPNYLCSLPQCVYTNMLPFKVPASIGGSPGFQGPQNQPSEAEKSNWKGSGYFIQVDELWRHPDLYLLYPWSLTTNLVYSLHKITFQGKKKKS